jgi:hypothetical protein
MENGLPPFINILIAIDALRTYGCPKLPPLDATVLPAIIMLKFVFNQLKQAAAQKISMVDYKFKAKIMTNPMLIQSYHNPSRSLSPSHVVSPGCCITLTYIMLSKALRTKVTSTATIPGYKSAISGSITFEIVSQTCSPKSTIFSRQAY